MIVLMLPVTPRVGRRRNAVERGATLEFFFIDARTAFHLSVLFRSPRGRCGVGGCWLLASPGQRQAGILCRYQLVPCEWETGAPAAPWPSSRDWCRDTCEDIGVGRDTWCSHPTPYTENISGRQPSRSSHRPARTRWVVPYRREWVGWPSCSCASNRRTAEVTADSADRCGRSADAMHAVDPDARPHCPSLQVAASLLEELYGLFGQPSVALHPQKPHEHRPVQ